MDEIFKELAGQGVVGAILVWFMIANKSLVKVIISLVENNTKAMTDLKGSVDGLKAAQERRRKEFS